MTKCKKRRNKISIHALREEGDGSGSRRLLPVRYFYPRPPRGGRLARSGLSSRCSCISIHALREEGDLPRQPAPAKRSYFYPRPPRGGRLKPPDAQWYKNQFLSTPSARRATWTHGTMQTTILFLSTPSARRATAALGEQPVYNKDFYPRPPRGGRLTERYIIITESTFLSTPSARRATVAIRSDNGILRNFYPRPPRGGRHVENLFKKC